LALDSLPSCAN